MPLEYWHLLTAFSREEADMLDGGKAIGMTLLSAGGKPLGFGGVFFQANAQGEAVATMFFYGGPNEVFVRKYLKLAMLGMYRVFARLIDLGVARAYAVADNRIDKSRDLVRWLGGTSTGLHQDEGEVFAFELAETALMRRMPPNLR